MIIRIDPRSAEPIFEQIAFVVKNAIARGDAKAGEKLPSVRELARELAINPNTVARAFTTLQNEGVIESLRGRGMVVCNDAVEMCLDERAKALGERIGAALAEACVKSAGTA